MKKFYAIVAAALVSVAMFAAPSVVPTDDQLASYATKTYTMCIYNEGACNDIVLIGTYVSWNTSADLEKFQAVEGFEGWYVVSWDDATDPAGDGGIQAKPVQLDGSGNFNWDYQLANDAELIRGGSTDPNKPTMNLNGNEVDIKNLQPGIVVIEVKNWKKNPCTAVYHVYNVALVSPDCNDEEFITPAISGGFNNWAQQAMTMNQLKTAERQQKNLPGAVYEISFKAAEGSEFKFRSAEEWGKDWSNELKEYDAENDDWKGFSGAGIVQVSGTNLLLGGATDLFFDLGDPEKYSWTNCEKPEIFDEKEFDYEITIANIPVCGEAVLSIVGGFESCNWSVASAVEVVDGKASLHAKNTDEFKFADKSIGDWGNEIVGFAQTTFHKADVADGDEDGKIAIDLAETQFAACSESAVENIAAGAVATKVIRNGQIIIVKGDVEFNVLGTQVK